MDNPNHLFTLRVPWNDGLIVIRAFNGGFQSPNHTRIDVEVRFFGVVIFPRGQLYCGLPRGFDRSLNGIHAKERVLSLVGMSPGDTEASYFEDYTSKQLEFARAWSDELNMTRKYRYCDKNGNVKSKKGG